MHRLPHQHRSYRRNRAGAAIAEFAVCLPVLILIAFGAIETANTIFLKQVVSQVAYEGARLASLPDTSDSDVLSLCNQILTARNIAGTTVSVSPSGISSATASGTPITVTVQASASANALIPQWFFQTAIMKKQVVMVRI
jgi:Flp pilus assembly protein TadG